MKIFYLVPFLFVLFIHPYFSGAQNVDQQILLRVKASTIQLPDGISHATFRDAKIKEPLKTRLLQFQVKEISRAFPSFQSRDTLRILENGRIYRTPDYSNLFVINIPKNKNRDSLITLIKNIPGIINVEKNQRVKFLGEVIPNDPHFGKQWNLKNTGQAGGTPGVDVKATFAWSVSTGSSNIKLAVVDDGVDIYHEDFSGRATGDDGSAFLGDHGTEVAGIMAATGNNGKGIAGIDWKAEIYSRIFWGDITSAIVAINDAVNYGAKVINCSWGFPDYSQELFNAFKSAYQAGVLLVAPTPGSGSDVRSPQEFGSWMLNVGSIDNIGFRAFYLLQKPYTDISAPGGDMRSRAEAGIYTTLESNYYAFDQGPSFAAPHVSGAAGLLFAANNNLKNYDIEHLLERTAGSYPTKDPYLGYGLINIYEAIKRVVSPYSVTHGTASFTKRYSNEVWTFLSDPLPGWSAGNYIVDMYEFKATANYNYQETPWAWLSINEPGFSGANPNDAQPYFYENITSSNMEIKTFFYYIKVQVASGLTVNEWVPYDPTIFPAEYTVIGKVAPLSVTITGPTYLNSGQTGTFTANPSGGSGTYVDYRWWERNDEGTLLSLSSQLIEPNAPPPGYWIEITSVRGQQTIQRGHPWDFSLKCEVTDSDGNTATDIHSVTVGGPAFSVSKTEEAVSLKSVPVELTLSNNYPNPFNPLTTIRFGLPKDSRVTLTIYSPTGERVATLVDGRLSAGYHQVQWDGTNAAATPVASGVYVYELKTRQQRLVKKMLLVR